MRRVELGLLVVCLSACDPAASSDDAGLRDVGADAPVALDAGGGGDDAGSDASCETMTFAADCDGDGSPAAGAETIGSCRAPSGAPDSCAGAGARWVPAGSATDCDDADALATTVAPLYADCDGDGLAEAGAVSMTSCGIPGEAPASCGLGEVATWTTTDPDVRTDCDDHARAIGEASTWYVDCDEDGFAPEGLGTVVSCNAPASAPAPCGVSGGWTDREPTHGAYAADNESTDCVDGDDDVWPGQMMYFTTPIEGLTAHIYDYDCNGSDDREHARSYTCSASMTGPGMYTCMWPGVPGWVGLSPACGADGTLGRGCTITGPAGGCRPASSMDITAACR